MKYVWLIYDYKTNAISFTYYKNLINKIISDVLVTNDIDFTWKSICTHMATHKLWALLLKPVSL